MLTPKVRLILTCLGLLLSTFGSICLCIANSASESASPGPSPPPLKGNIMSSAAINSHASRERSFDYAESTGKTPRKPKPAPDPEPVKDGKSSAGTPSN